LRLPRCYPSLRFRKPKHVRMIITADGAEVIMAADIITAAIVDTGAAIMAGTVGMTVVITAQLLAWAL
jgi:homoaconitase/3-isopropylmalate dehydratase large subunit